MRLWPFGGKLKEAARHTGEVEAELKQKIQTALEEKNRIIAILESMAESVAVIDTDQKMLIVNSVLARVLGFPKGQLEGRHFWEAFRDPEINQMLKNCLEDRRSAKIEHTLLLSKSVFEIQVSPVFAGSQFLGAVAVFHDVTRLKELERLRAEFVANVSHELKTPLTSIMGFVETLKEGAIEDPANRLQFLQIVDDHSRKLYGLIDDLLLLSKLESDREAIHKETVDFEKMLERTLRLFDRALQAKQIKVHEEMERRPFFILADPKSIEEALSNLVDNAIKYNHPGGTLRIHASSSPQAVKIAVSDTGIGIPDEDLPRIFERFYRADKSRSRDSGGSGLGLSIVKHIVEKHGGRVEAQSQFHQGSTFTITLPV